MASYDYSRGHRLLEIAGIGAFLALTARLGWWVGCALWGPCRADAWWILPLVPVAYVAADFVSGFVHFLADNFGSPETPLLGPSFVEPFRHHHVEPDDITRHDFIETNGNNCLISMPALVPAALLLPLWPGAATVAVGTFVLAFVLAIFATNQFHKWAHSDEPPRFVAALQKVGLILSPENHDRHHTAPFDTYYCITCGWLNPILERVRFYEGATVVLRGLGLPEAEEPEPEASLG